MGSNQFQLSLDRDGKNHFSISIFSLLVYLSLIFLFGLIAVGQSLSLWQKDIFGHLTLQILPDFEENLPLNQVKDNLNANTEEALKIISNYPGISSVNVIDEESARKLISPWISTDNFSEEIILPVIIDLSIEPRLNFSLEELKFDLGKNIDGFELIEDTAWLQQITRVGHLFKFISFAILIFILFVSGTTIYFLTTSSLMANGKIIELLYLFGAKDSFIVEKFQRQNFKDVIKGVFLGYSFFVISWLPFYFLARKFSLDLFFNSASFFVPWYFIFLFPIIFIFISQLVVKRSVLKRVQRIF